MKKSIKLTIVAFIAGLLFNACKPAAYISPDFKRARKTHHTLAILPFDVLLSAKQLPKGVTPEILATLEQNTGYALQNTAYTYLLQEQSKDKYSVTFQDIEQTNALLAKNGISYAQTWDKTKAELCTLLGVDALVSGKAEIERPLSDAAAIAVGVLFNGRGRTNSVDMSFSVYDNKGKLMWKYDDSASGGLGSDAQGLAAQLARKASKRFPYRGK